MSRYPKLSNPPVALFDNLNDIELIEKYFPNKLNAYTSYHIVDKITGCWIYLGEIKDTGYGVLRLRKLKNLKRIPIHRLYFQKYNKVILKSSDILDHLCRNKRCCNPEHLELVSFIENIRRGNAAKLNIEEVAEIKKLLSEGNLTHYQIAIRFNISRVMISAINCGSYWKDINSNYNLAI